MSDAKWMRWVNIGGAVVVLLSAALLFGRTLQPTLGGMFNSEEYQFAAYSLDIVHPTGYPLFLLLGKLWVTLVPFGDIALRMNLFSAWWGILAAVLAYWMILHLTENAAAGIVGALIFVTNEFVWRYSSVAEVDTLTAFLAASVFSLLLLWRAKRVPLEVCALVYGLALVHHRTSVFYLVGIVPFVWLTAPEVSKSPKGLLRTIGLMLLPLLLYAYVPIRASALGVLGNGEWVLTYILGAASASGNVAGAEAWLGRFDFIYNHLLAGSLSVPALVVAAFGFVSFQRAELPNADNLATKLLFLLPLIGVTLFTIPYNQPDIDRYLLVPVLIVAVWCGVGLARAIRLLESFVPSRAVVYLGGALLLLLAFALLPARAALANLPLVDYSKNYRVYDFWDEAFNQPIEPNAIVIGNWGEMNAMRYMQQVEGRRRDLKIVGTSASADELAEKLETALGEAGAVYLTPGDPTAQGNYQYTAVGPLLRASRGANQTLPAFAVSDQVPVGGLVLEGHSMNVALEPASPEASVTVEPGRTVRVSLHWRTDENVKQDYEFSSTLLDNAGVVLWQRTESPLRGLFPTSGWRKGAYVTTVHNVYIPPGTPPASYQIQTRLIAPETNEPLAPDLIFDGVTVTRGAQPLADEIFLRKRTGVDLEGLTLLGFGGGGETLRAGDTLNVSLGWQAKQQPLPDYLLRFHLRDANGHEWATLDSPVVRTYPTDHWQKGDAFKEYYALTLPDTAPEGEQALYVSLVVPSGEASASASEPELLFSFQIANQ